MQKSKVIGAGIIAALLAVWIVAEATEFEHGFHQEAADVIATGPGPHFIHGGFSGSMLFDPMHLVFIAERLKLTPEQRNQVGKVLDATAPKQRELAFKLADAHEVLKALHDSDPDDKQLRQLADQHGKLMSDMLYLHLKMRSDLHALLTEEQREDAEKLFGHHGFMRAGGPGHFFNMPVPPPLPFAKELD